MTVIGMKLTNQDKVLRRRFFSTIGLFTSMSVIFWMTRVIQRTIYYFDHHEKSEYYMFWSFIPIYLSGSLYALIFFSDKKTLEQFEHQRLSTSSSIIAYEDHKLLKEWLETTTFPDDDEPRISLLSEDSREEARL